MDCKEFSQFLSGKLSFSRHTTSIGYCIKLDITDISSTYNMSYDKYALKVVMAEKPLKFGWHYNYIIMSILEDMNF